MTTLTSWLEWYASLGWYLTPIHEPRPDGGCTCGPTEECRVRGSQGKHPRLSGWRHEGSSNVLEELEIWWSGRAESANIGLLCDRSRVLVVDLDAHHPERIGLVELHKILAARGLELPPTPRARTGGGGEHLFFAWDESTLGPAPNGNVAELGIDLKWRGQVLLTPSLHASGLRYEWVPGSSPADVPLAVPSSDLIAILRGLVGARQREASLGGLSEAGRDLLSRALKDGPKAGERDEVFNAHAFHLKLNGFTPHDAVAAQRELWERTEQPPDNEYPWSLAFAKVRRIYEDESIMPDPVDPALERWANRPGAGNASPEGGSVPPPAPNTDVANAQRFATLAINKFIWVPQYARKSEAWFRFDNQRWLGDIKQQHIELAKQVATVIRQEAGDAIEASETEVAARLATWARESEQSGRIASMVRLAQPLLAISASDLDQKEWLLNTPAGIIDLQRPGGEPRAAEPDDLLTKLTALAPAERAPEAPLRTRAPHWAEFLETAVPDPEVRDYIQEALGYSLVGVTSEKVIFLVCGPTGTGKTIFSETIHGVLGDYAITVPTQYITPVGPGGNEDRLRLFTLLKGARLALASEPESGARLSTATVKDLVGGHHVSARDLFESAHSYRPEATLWLDTNHFPKVEDFDDSIWEKLRVIPFVTQWPEERKRPRDDVLRDLLSEGEQILRWMLDGLERWLRNGKVLREPTSIRAARTEERQGQDWIAEFLEETTVQDPVAGVACAEVYRAYQAWASLRGVNYLWTQTRLTRELKQGRALPVGKWKGDRAFLGIRLRTSEDPEPDLGI